MILSKETWIWNIQASGDLDYTSQAVWSHYSSFLSVFFTFKSLSAVVKEVAAAMLLCGLQNFTWLLIDMVFSRLWRNNQFWFLDDLFLLGALTLHVRCDWLSDTIQNINTQQFYSQVSLSTCHQCVFFHTISSFVGPVNRLSPSCPRSNSDISLSSTQRCDSACSIHLESLNSPPCCTFLIIMYFVLHSFLFHSTTF